MTVFRNFFPAAKKLPRKVARWLSVFFCLPLRSLPGAAELAPLRQSSPYFRLLPRSRQPDKGGHFSSPTLPATLRVRAVALCHSERGQQADEESRTICLRFFTTLTLRSEWQTCHLERMWEISCFWAFRRRFICHLERKWEISHNNALLVGDSSFHFVPFRMTAFPWAPVLCHSEQGRQADEESPCHPEPAIGGVRDLILLSV